MPFSAHDRQRRETGIVTDLAQYKDILETRKRELYRRLNKIEKDLDTLKSGDSADRAIERENDEVLEEFGTTGLKELGAIDAALDRLAAVPHAALCEECIAQQ
jgi:RNA polymerase-binding transcription factor DksA